MLLLGRRDAAKWVSLLGEQVRKNGRSGGGCTCEFGAAKHAAEARRARAWQSTCSSSSA